MIVFMQKSIKLLLILSFLSLVFGKMSGQEIQTRSLAQTGDLTIPSSTVIVNSNLQMHFQTDSTNIILMLEVTSYGYVGIGFGATMTDCDMVIFTTSGGQVSVSDTFSTSRSFPSASEPQDWTILGQDLQTGSFKVKASRLLNTNDSFDKVLVAGQSYTFNAAWASSQSLDMHSGFTSFSVSLSNGLGSSSAKVVQTSQTALDAHRVILFFGWGLGVDVAIMVARYMKTWKHYLLFHTVFFFLLDIVTVILEVIIINANKAKLSSDNITTEVNNHYIIGIIVLIILILQHIMGVVLKFFIEGNTQKVHVIKKIHQVIGIILYILCKINVITGTQVDSSITNGIVITVVSMVIMIAAEVFHRLYLSRTRHDIHDYSYNEVEMEPILEKSEDNNELMRMLNIERRDIGQIILALPQLKWVVYNQGVYNVTEFVHPGGQYIINNVIGREIGRYMIGSFALEGFQSFPHVHSAASVNFLKKQLIGYLDYGESNIFEIQHEKGADPKGIKNELKLYHPFSIESIEKKSNTISQFNFNSDVIKVKNILYGVHWIGRHFQIKVAQQSKSRLYTQVLCMTKENSAFRSQLIDFAEKTLNSQIANPINASEFSKYSTTLPLILKKYDFKGALSKTIHDQNIRNTYSIQGPLGTGMNFSENTQNKKILLLCAGTGILPFLDLLDFLLKKTLMQLLPAHKQALDPFNVDYDKYFNGCEFTLITGFQNKEDFIGNEWISKLYKLNKIAQNQLFTMIVKLSSGDIQDNVPKMTHKTYGAYIQDNIESTSFDKVYICGPPPMYNQSIDALKKKGIFGDSIFIV